MKKFLDFLYKFRWVLILSIVLLISASFILSYFVKKDINLLILEKKEKQRPPNMVATLIKLKNCQPCNKVNENIINYLKSLKINFKDIREIVYNKKGQIPLIQELNINLLPAIILTGEIDKNETIKNILEFIGARKNKYIVISGVLPPYYDLQKGLFKGNFEIIYLVKKNCKGCYDVKRHKRILERFSMYPSSEKEVDIDSIEGKKLVSDFNIKKIPTIILKGDLSVYENFDKIWKNVGKIVEDNIYIFDSVERMGGYFDLSKNTFIKPELNNN